mmetsp:Transcript_107540/g.213582  ORF Transcript_107540/g.213582 Transcript_107540/m.213582 type:complete len:150 (-) Transcript_107540:176-625(-)
MPKGILKRWNAEKGFGFLEPSDGGEDVFCHVSAMVDGEGSVREGDLCSYKMTYDERKGKERAADVVLCGGGGRGRKGRDNSRDDSDHSRDRGRGRGRDDSRSRDRGRHRGRGGREGGNDSYRHSYRENGRRGSGRGDRDYDDNDDRRGR